jgi:hypothetical protein
MPTIFGPARRSPDGLAALPRDAAAALAGDLSLTAPAGRAVD